MSSPSLSPQIQTSRAFPGAAALCSQRVRDSDIAPTKTLARISPPRPITHPFGSKECGTRKTKTAPFAHRQDCLCHANRRSREHRQDHLFYLNRPRGTGNPACVAAPAADAVAFLSHQQKLPAPIHPGSPLRARPQVRRVPVPRISRPAPPPQAGLPVPHRPFAPVVQDCLCHGARITTRRRACAQGRSWLRGALESNQPPRTQAPALQPQRASRANPRP